MSNTTDLREKCARCGHAWSFHQKAEGQTCRAMGCKGAEGERCPAFVHAPEPSLSTSA